MVIPEFDQFCDQVRVLYNDLKNNMDGSVSVNHDYKIYISYKALNKNDKYCNDNFEFVVFTNDLAGGLYSTIG